MVLPRFAVPTVFGTFAHRNPTGNIPGHGIRFLCRFKTSRLRLALLEFIPLVQFTVLDKARSTVDLEGCLAFSCNDPLRTGHHFIIDEPGAFIITFEQAWCFLHFTVSL